VTGGDVKKDRSPEKGAFVRGAMEENINERLRELCEQAANERNSVKLMALIVEINRLFDEKENLKKVKSTSAA
jgi:hypothetical protein